VHFAVTQSVHSLIFLQRVDCNKFLIVPVYVHCMLLSLYICVQLYVICRTVSPSTVMAASFLHWLSLSLFLLVSFRLEARASAEETRASTEEAMAGVEEARTSTLGWVRDGLP